MKQKILLLWLGFLLIFPVACRRGQDVDQLTQQEIEKLKSNAGNLEITFHSPEGSTDLPSNIVVSFNQPMKALAQVVEEPAPVFDISPTIPGSFRWLGTRTVAFYPTEHFPYATNFKVSVPATTTSLLGRALGQDVTWSFSTPAPKVISVTPSAGKEGAARDQKMTLSFNQPVSPDDVAAYARLRAKFADPLKPMEPKEISFKAVRPPDEKNNDRHLDQKVMLEPNERFPMEALVTLTVSDKLTGMEGKIPMGSPYESSFTTHGVFGVNGLECTQLCAPENIPAVMVSNPLDAKIFSEKVVIIPKPLSEVHCYYYDQKVSCEAGLEAQTTYTLTIPADLEDDFEQKLGTEVQLKFTTKSFNPSLDFKGGFGVLEATGPKEYYAHALNVEGLKARAKLIGEDELWILLGNNDFQDSRIDPFETEEFDREWDVPTPASKNVMSPVTISMAPILPPESNSFLLLDVTSPNLTYYDNERALEMPEHHKALLQITDLGISSKWSPTNSVFWITRLSTGLPVDGARVAVHRQNGDQVWVGSTDKQGMVAGPGLSFFVPPSTADTVEEEGDYQPPENLVVMVSKGVERAFSQNTWNEGFYPWDFGLAGAYSTKPRQLRGYVFTERGVYRPGETVHVKGMLREETGGQLSLYQEEIDAVAVNGRGDEFMRQTVTSSATGSFAFDLPLSDAAGAGFYRIDIQPKNKNVETSASSSFQVEWFRSPEFKVDVSVADKSFVAGSAFEALIAGQYLFGAPMRERAASWTLTKKKTVYNPPDQSQEYQWGLAWEENPEDWLFESSVSVGEGEKELDVSGQLLVNIPTTEKETTPMQYLLSAEVVDINRQAISAQGSVVVHPADVYVGIKPSTFFASTGNPLSAHLKSVSIDGKNKEGLPIHADWLRVEWHSVKKKSFNGAFRTQTEKIEKVVHSCDVTSSTTQPECSFIPTQTGLYLIRAKTNDTQGRTALSSAAVYVSGSDFGGWKQEDSHQLTLVADKKFYQTGDVGHILIQSPFPKAQALVTYERGSIIEKKIVDLDGYSPTIDVPLTSDSIPNIYVSVMLVSGRISDTVNEAGDDVGKPTVKVGTIQLDVDPKPFEMNVTVSSVKPAYKPGEEASCDIIVTGADGKPVANAELTIMAVDEGVLRLTGYTLPDPMNFFYATYGLGVDTSDSRIYLVGRRGLRAKMDAESAGGGFMSNFRKNFVPTAYWNPSVLTDESGKANVRFKLPDNLSTFKLMAVATADVTQFGSGETSFTTRKELMIRPALPRIARVNDKFRAGAVIHNETDQQKKIEVTAHVEGALVSGAAEHTITLKARESKEVTFDIQVPETDKISLSFTAKSSTDEDAVLMTLPVEYPLMAEVVSTYGSTKTVAQEVVNKPTDIFNKDATLSVAVSASRLVGLEDELKNLDAYPYGCLEQKISKVYPYLAATDLIRALGVMDDEKSQKMSERIRALILEIEDQQNYYGGFSYWRGSFGDSPYLTAYVSEFLSDALQSGYEVKPETLENAKKYLNSKLVDKSNDAPVLAIDEKVAILRALKRMGTPIDSWFDTLAADFNHMSFVSQITLAGFMAEVNPDDPRVADWLAVFTNRAVVDNGRTYFTESRDALYSPYLNSTRRTTAVMASFLMQYVPDHALIDSTLQYLMVSGSGNLLKNTHETIWVLKTFDLALKQESQSSFAALVQAGSKELINVQFDPADLREEKMTVPLDELKDSETIVFKKEGEGKMFYNSQLKYRRKTLPAFSIEEGMTVSHRLETTDGKPLIGKIKAGETYAVRINLVLPRDSDHVAFRDSLAAGLEPVNPNLQGQGVSSLKAWRANPTTATLRLEDLVTHTELRDDAALFFADFIPAGSYDLIYYVRATTPGTFSFPPPRAEEMYHPEIFGQGILTQLEIAP